MEKRGICKRQRGEKIVRSNLWGVVGGGGGGMRGCIARTPAGILQGFGHGN
jgi:hypothetical protein